MMRAWLVLAVLFAGQARGAAPSYSADSIVNGANFAPGPLAPNSVVTLFGTNLSWSTAGVSDEQAGTGILPTFLADTRVYVANYVAPLLFVSPTQINFLIPGNLRPGKVMVRVARQGVTGPSISVTLVDAAPQLFQTDGGYLVAQHADASLITPDAPATPGETVVLYATGLGKTKPNPDPGVIPVRAAWITRLSDLQVLVAGSLLSPDQIQYVGVSPGLAGVYQINLILPPELDPDPEIRVAIGEQMSSEGPKLAVNSSQPQPDSSESR
jgi:uncharacterized protein (TIGR03437 family)